MNLVLNEVVDQWHQGSEEEASHDLTILDGTTVVGAQRKAAQRPRQGRNEVRDHEDIVPVMIVSGSDIGPSSAGQGAEDTHASDDLRERRVRPRGKHVPQEDEGEARTGSDGDEDLEERAFGITVTDRRGDGGKPFVGIAVVFILNNLVVMQSATDNQRAEERGIREQSVSP